MLAEQDFTAEWERRRMDAQKLGVRMPALELDAARRVLSGHRDSSGFARLARLERLDLSLEALCVDARFTELFSDREVNNALTRLLDAGYFRYSISPRK